MKQGPRIWTSAMAVCLVLASCAAAPPTAPRRSSSDVFVMLGSLGNLLNFPATPEMLAECVTRKDDDCVALHSTFRLAVGQLFEAGPAEALRHTLEAVDGRCRAPESSPDRVALSEWQGCRGAVVAFYFFSRDAEDRAILSHLEALDEDTLRHALVESQGYAGDWVSNRPDRQRWIAFVKARATLSDHGLVAVFTNPARPHTGVSLLDPRSDAH